MLMCWSAAPLRPHSGASHSKNKGNAARAGVRADGDLRGYSRQRGGGGGSASVQSVRKPETREAAIRDERASAFKQDGAPCSGGKSLRDGDYQKHQTFKPIKKPWRCLTVSPRYAAHASAGLQGCAPVCVLASFCKHVSCGGSGDGAISRSRPGSPPSLPGRTGSFSSTSLARRPLSVSSTRLRRSRRSADAPRWTTKA